MSLKHIEAAIEKVADHMDDILMAKNDKEKKIALKNSANRPMQSEVLRGINGAVHGAISGSVIQALRNKSVLKGALVGAGIVGAVHALATHLDNKDIVE